MEYWKFNRFGRAVCPQTVERLLGDKQPYQMYRIIVACVAMFMGVNVFAAPYVTNVVAKQRYPWGIVDISCDVKGIEEKDKGLEFTIDAVSSNSGITNKVSHVHFRGWKTSGLEVTTNGNYRFVWDANKDIGHGLNKDIVVRVSLRGTMVQLWEDGPYWATRNIGANEPWEYGYYFWWGDIVGYKKENGKWVASDGSNSNFSFEESNTPTRGKDILTLKSEGWITADGVLTPEHDAAQVQWGAKWRMPTKQEFDDLLSKCDWTRTTMNGVNGYNVRGKGEYVSSSIFLPCAGYGAGLSISVFGGECYYWSSVPNLDNSGSALHLLFYSRYGHTSSNNRVLGQSVRPLQGFTK